MAALEPLSLTPIGELACAECGRTVTGILLPIRARLRPRANPEGSEIIADVIVDGAESALEPCGHSYPTDDLQSHRMGEAQPEN